MIYIPDVIQYQKIRGNEAKEVKVSSAEIENVILPFALQTRTGVSSICTSS